MKLLFVLSEPSYPDVCGVRLPAYNAMRLMAEDHEVASAILIPPETRPYDLEPLQTMCSELYSSPLCKRSRWAVMARAMARNTMFYMERWRNEEFRCELKALVERFQPDAIHFDSITMTQYLDCCPAGVGSVASVNDCLTLSAENYHDRWGTPIYMYRQIQYRQILRYERTVYPRFDAVHLMSEVDAGRLKEISPDIHTVVIPNGTKMDFRDERSMDPENRDVLTVISSLTGKTRMSLTKFLRTVWPVVRQARPEVKLHVIGRKTAALSECECIAKEVGGVVFEGFVEHLRDAYAKGSIALSLTDKDCGVLNKVIEAMAAQQCVIGFRRGFAGLRQAVDGENCLMVHDFEGFARELLHAMEDTALRHRIQLAARKTAEDTLSWDSRKLAYETMYRQARENV